jgi:hypothetical protein
MGSSDDEIFAMVLSRFLEVLHFVKGNLCKCVDGLTHWPRY